MNQTTRNMRNVMDSADAGWEGLRRRVTGSPSRLTTLLGLIVVGIVALLTVPVRDSVGTANIALTMGIVVVIVGARAGFWPGTIVAVVSGAAFALLHTVPHGLPRVENRQDLVTAILLVLAGVFAGWIHDRTERLRERLRETGYGLSALHRVAEVAASSDSSAAEVIEVVTNQIASELGLEECRRVDQPLGTVRELQHNGLIADAPADSGPAENGAVVADGVGIDLHDGSHLLLVGPPGAAIDRYQLRLAIMLADYAAAVLERSVRRGDARSRPDR